MYTTKPRYILETREGLLTSFGERATLLVFIGMSNDVGKFQKNST